MSKERSGDIQNNNEQQTEVTTRPKGWRSYIIEPAAFLYCLASYPQLSTTRQYLYEKIGKQYHFDYLIRTETAVCEVNHTDPGYLVQQEIQKETSIWRLYFDVAFCIAAMLTTIMLGSYSDRGGRKIILIIPVIGEILELFVYLIDGYFNLHISFLLIANVVHGLSGSWMIFMSSALAYVADITDESERTFRITLVCAILEVGGASGEIGLGYFVRNTGFAYPFLTSLAVLVLVVFYIIIFVPETVQDTTKKSTISDVYKSMYRLYFKEATGFVKRRWKLITLLITSFIIMTPNTSPWDVLNLKMLNYPLCFNPVLLGYWAFTAIGSRGVGSMIFVKLLSIRLEDITLFVIGALCGVIYYIMVTLAYTKLMMFLAPIVGMLWTVPLSVIRSMMSKLVGPDEQGAVSASVATVQTVSCLVGHVILNAIYTVTVTTYDGICFIILASLCLLAVIIMIPYNIRVKREAKRFQELTERAPLVT
ncbi:unnamed protein product [Owenia fusiformis]|uniref:Uncharacterized protein n=1 Tax=Owenia fusiformis TaxID=6347 RepID=A0A8J1TW68_OWEFU|nr:unnamed protein product [Owenia fusiformis]